MLHPADREPNFPGNRGASGRPGNFEAESWKPEESEKANGEVKVRRAKQDNSRVFLHKIDYRTYQIHAPAPSVRADRVSRSFESDNVYYVTNSSRFVSHSPPSLPRFLFSSHGTRVDAHLSLASFGRVSCLVAFTHTILLFQAGLLLFPAPQSNVRSSSRISRQPRLPWAPISGYCVLCVHSRILSLLSEPDPTGVLGVSSSWEARPSR